MSELRLHIGGREAHPDWKILDIEQRPEVDFVGDAACLNQFSDNSVSAIYASHVLEHFHHSLNNELTNTLKEWHRVLIPGGRLYISVPDLRVLCWLYLNPELQLSQRHHLMKIIFGGHSNAFDVHRVGFDAEILAMYLGRVGFRQYQKVKEFNLFNDCSRLRIQGILISLNVVAFK